MTLDDNIYDTLGSPSKTLSLSHVKTYTQYRTLEVVNLVATVVNVYVVIISSR